MTGRQKRELLILIVVVVVALVAGGLFRSYQGREKPVASQLQPSPRVAATVNGAEILSEDVDKYFRATLGMLDMGNKEIPSKMRQEVRRNSLTQIVEETLLVAGAKARGIPITDEEVESYIDSEMRGEFHSEKDFLESLEADIGFDLKDLRKMVRPWIAKDKILKLLAEDIEVTDEEVEAEIEAYREMLKDHPGGEVPLPSREEVAANIRMRKAETEYELWMDTLLAEADIEILDPELQPGGLAEGSAHASPEAPVGPNHTGAPAANGQPDKTTQ
jgi:uncharacterized membrane protein